MTSMKNLSDGQNTYLLGFANGFQSAAQCASILCDTVLKRGSTTVLWDSTIPTTRQSRDNKTARCPNSTIAKERAKDTLSKILAAYKTVSDEYDDDMLESPVIPSNMSNWQAGLFSAINTAFIIVMQPNPTDTTNVLLVQLIQTTFNVSSATQPMILPLSTGFSSSNSWM
ncbi:hypothetical protein EDB19DRAFT_2026578 [Suillus lakei]|nr:hypothetical protein EDB19DRAFT_2026578 [Suillus lakei]